MRTTLTLAAILLAGAASAASINPGQAQLATQLGVSNEGYSLSQLTQLAAERKEDGYGQVKTNAPLLANTTVSGGYNAGKAQLAAQLGLNADDYTLSQLTEINAHRIDDGAGLIDANYAPTFAPEVNNPDNAGKLQLAAQLKLDPNQYTLAELTQIAADRRGADS